ncbi:MAG: hypothetical protein IPH11_08710 [Ignavibacteriales bacterium]|nr:hypothetical protein [Ignavibacteriales bacterium]
MSHSTYLPPTYDGQDTWAENFATKLPSHSAALGLSPAQQTALLTAITNMRTAYATQKSTETSFHSSVQDAIAKRAIALNQPGGVRKMVNLMKASPNYTLAIGEDLGIENSNPEPNPNDLQATIKAQSLPLNKVKIHCKLQGADAYNIYCKRGTETNPVLIATSVTPWYLDERANLNGAPERREYFNVLVIKNQEIGIVSPTLIVIVG